MANNNSFTIHTDGGSRGNPGPSAIGIVIESKSGTLKKEYSEFLGYDITNNEAEYQAVLFALKKLKALVGKEKSAHATIELYVDSELLERQLNGKFKVKDPEIQKLFLEVWNLKLDFGTVNTHHIYREKNKAADRLVNVALDKEEDKLL